MEHYKYINIIRKPNGQLRSWEEYDILERSERLLDLDLEEETYIKARKIKENEERERIQKRL